MRGPEQFKHQLNPLTRSLTSNHHIMATGASSGSPAAPRTADLEAGLPHTQLDSVQHVDRHGCFNATLFIVKQEWKTGSRQMRHWVAITVIMILAVGLAVYYTAGKHD